MSDRLIDESLRLYEVDSKYRWWYDQDREEYFSEKENLPELLERLNRPEECVAIYVLLNEIFRNERLYIMRSAKVSVDGRGTVRILFSQEFPEEEPFKSVNVSLETFGQIVKDYWEPIVKKEMKARAPNK